MVKVPLPWQPTTYKQVVQHYTRKFYFAQISRKLRTWELYQYQLLISTILIITLMIIMIIMRYFIHVIASFCCWYMRFQGLGLLPFWTSISRRGATVRPHYTHTHHTFMIPSSVTGETWATPCSWNCCDSGGNWEKKRKKMIIAEVLNNLQDICESWKKAEYFTWIGEHINFVKLKQEGGMPYPCCLQIHPWISTPPLSHWNSYLIFHKKIIIRS
jgi:hypothetical protein